jgi:3-hydroxybutyrate dehydrogenase
MAEKTLEGRLALVTGSTSGIGLGMAHALAQRGCNLVINGFGDAGEIGRLVDTMARENGVKVVFEGGDLSKVADIERLMKQCAERHGGVDILINNAGIQFVSPIEDFPVERWDAILALNLSAVFHTTRLALPAMKQRGWGRIINIASAHGLVASAEKSAYVAAKHGVVGLTKTAAMEYAEDGIRVNCVNPGYITTPMTKEAVETRGAEILAKVPMGRMGIPEEIAEAVVWMCSDKASFMTGASQIVDGGYYAA